MEQFNNSENEKIIPGEQSAAYIEGQKEARRMFLEELLANDDSYENWLALDREIRISLSAKEDPAFKKSLEEILHKSKWHEWAQRMNARDDKVSELFLRIQKETGTTDMKKLEEFLNVFQTDPQKFMVMYEAFKNKN